MKIGSVFWRKVNFEIKAVKKVIVKTDAIIWAYLPRIITKPVF
jgi:hypothetical protein